MISETTVLPDTSHPLEKRKEEMINLALIKFICIATVYVVLKLKFAKEVVKMEKNNV